jgi:hypothetical protein
VLNLAGAFRATAARIDSVGGWAATEEPVP